MGQECKLPVSPNTQSLFKQCNTAIPSFLGDSGILIAVGKGNSYNRLEPVDIDGTKSIIVNQEKLSWADSIKDKPKLDFLANIKPAIGAEPYLKMNITRYEQSLLCQLRYGILQIQLETGRYQGQVRNDRHCKICEGGVLEDQYHFVFKCPAYTLRRGIFIDRIKDKVVNWNTLSETEKFTKLFNEHPRLLGKFVKDIFLYRKSIIYK